RGSAKSLVDLSPVDDIPPCGDVVGASVLVLEVIGVLPHVETEDDLLAFHQRAVLIRCAFDGELRAIGDYPRPAASESSNRRLRELILERLEAAKRSVQRIGNRAARRSTGSRRHELPEHRVIRVAATVISHSCANGFWHSVDAVNQFLDAFRRQLWMLL